MSASVAIFMAKTELQKTSYINTIKWKTSKQKKKHLLLLKLF